MVEHEKVVEGTNRQVKHQLNEIYVIMQSDTVIYEDTVMIHPDYTLVTRFAMPDTSWLNLITLLALFNHVD